MCSCARVLIDRVYACDPVKMESMCARNEFGVSQFLRKVTSFSSKLTLNQIWFSTPQSLILLSLSYEGYNHGCELF